MNRNITHPTVDDKGTETHPAFVTIGASRVSSEPPGAHLFDSEIRHQHTVRVTIRTANRRRDLNHDWIHGSKDIIEVEMSEAQWASFVSAMNSGSGVPCTLRYHNGVMIDEFPFDSRFALGREETQAAADRAFEEIKEAMVALDAAETAKDRKTAMQNLRSTINNATPNVDFAGRQLAKHAEDIVQKAKADVEAFVIQKAKQLGIDSSQLDVLELTAGEDG